MIAVTCRNGEQFSLDPHAIERVEHDGDTMVFLDDGTKFVLAGRTIDDLVRTVRDHHAAVLSARRRLAGPLPAPGHVPGRPYGRRRRVPVPAGAAPGED